MTTSTVSTAGHSGPTSGTSIVPAIEAHRLTKAYGRQVAVDQIDLRVEPGQVFGYLGSNGAGKTTTIRVLVGLLRPTGGTARVLGRDVVRDREEMQRRVGYLPGGGGAGTPTKPPE